MCRRDAKPRAASSPRSWRLRPPTPEKLPDYAKAARATWTASNAEYTNGRARESWSQKEITWGLWDTPESQIHVLPKLRGLEVIELGCGTAYFGAWLKKHGARRVIGVDVTPAQLKTARAMNKEFGLGLEFIEANAESVPLPDASFDLAVSEYGASLWCDPYRWIPEAARLLRPRGELVFLRNTDLEFVTSPDEGKVTKRLLRPLRGIHRLDWKNDDGSPLTVFHISTSDMFRLLRAAGFEVLDYRHLYALDGTKDHPYYSDTTASWARQWPSEEVWRARKLRSAQRQVERVERPQERRGLKRDIGRRRDVQRPKR